MCKSKAITITRQQTLQLLSALPALGSAERTFSSSNPCSHGAFALYIHLAAHLSLLAELLLCEGDVGIHQASCNTAKQPQHVSGGGDLFNATPSALLSCCRACFLTLLQERRHRGCSPVQKHPRAERLLQKLHPAVPPAQHSPKRHKNHEIVWVGRDL